MSDSHSTEIFKEVPGHPGYRVSNLGRIQSCWRRGSRPVLSGSWRDIKPSTTSKYGHMSVTLVNNKTKYFYGVHMIVLIAFVGPCAEGHECRHLDGNPKNNALTNLAWGTRSENAEDRTKHGKMTGENNPNAKLSNTDAAEIRRLVESGVSRKVVGERFGVNRHLIYQIVRNRIRTI